MSSTCTSSVESTNLTQETCTETNNIISQNDSISENNICTIATIKTEPIESFNVSGSDSLSKDNADTPSDHDCSVSQVANEENVKCENNTFGPFNNKFKESKILNLLDLNSSIQRKRDLLEFLRDNLDKEVFDSACAIFMHLLKGGYKKGTIVFDTIEHASKALNQLISVKNRPYKRVSMLKDRAKYNDYDFSILGNSELDDMTGEGSEKNVSKSPSSSTISENQTDDNIEHVLVLKHVDSAVSDTRLREYINKHLNEEARESIISCERTAARIHARITFKTKKGAMSAKYLLETAENRPFNSRILYQDRLNDRKRESPRDGDSPVPKKIKRLDGKTESQVLFISNVPRGWSKDDIMDFLKSVGLYDLHNIVKYVYRDYIAGTKTFSGRCHILFASPALATIASQKIRAAKGVFNGTSANVKFEYPDSDYAIPWLPNGIPDHKAIKGKKYWENRHEIEKKVNARQAVSQQKAVFQRDAVKETFELSQQFLESKDFPTPLVSKIIVENLPTRMNNEEKIKQMFSIAGKIEAVDFKYKSDDKINAYVEFDHPLEAVQAISMFNEQKVYDKKIYVTMDRSTDADKPVYPSGMEQLGPGLCANGNVMKNIRQSVELQSAVKKINDKIESMQNSIESLRHSIEELQKCVQKQDEASNKTEASTATLAESTNRLATLLTSLTNAPSSANSGLQLALSNLVNPQANVLQLLQQQNQTSNQPLTPDGDLNPSQSQVNWGSNQIGSQGTHSGSAQATNVQGTTGLLTSNRENESYTKKNPQNPNLQWADWQNAQGAPNWQHTQEPPNWSTVQNWQGWPNTSSGQFEHPAQVVQNVLAGWFAHCMQNGQNIATGQYGHGSQPMATGQYTQGGPTAVAGQYAQGGPTAITGQFAQGGPTAVTGQFAQGGPTAVTGQFAQGGPTAVTGQFSLGGPTTVTDQYSQNCPPMATVQYPLTNLTSVSGQYPPTGQYPTGTSTGQCPTSTPTGQLPQSQPKGQIGPNLNTDKYAQGIKNSANAGNKSQSSLNASTNKVIIGGHKSLSKLPEKNSHNTSKTVDSRGNTKKVHDPYTLQFSNLPPSVTLASLDSKMREVGPLRSTEMTGPGRAVVTFCSAQDARTCIKLLDDTKVDNQRIRVMYLSDL